MSSETMFESGTLTPEQYEQSTMVQGEVLALMKGLVREGVDYRIVSVGVSTALADMISSICGAGAVPVHFARLSAYTMHLGPPRTN
jgi:hypothetical protein